MVAAKDDSMPLQSATGALSNVNVSTPRCTVCRLRNVRGGANKPDGSMLWWCTTCKPALLLCSTCVPSSRHPLTHVLVRGAAGGIPPENLSCGFPSVQISYKRRRVSGGERHWQGASPQDLGTRCCKCSVEISGERYRCAECAHVDLCRTCFEADGACSTRHAFFLVRCPLPESKGAPRLGCYGSLTPYLEHAGRSESEDEGSAPSATLGAGGGAELRVREQMLRKQREEFWRREEHLWEQICALRADTADASARAEKSTTLTAKHSEQLTRIDVVNHSLVACMKGCQSCHTHLHRHGGPHDN